MKIFLTGFMGSGKTTLGQKLAHQFGIEFRDMDASIEQKAGFTIPEIFNTYGSAWFRKLENELLDEIARAEESAVIATGGGAPCYFNNMEIMNKSGVTVYLQLPPGALAERLRHGRENRPLITGKSDQELLAYIKQTLQEREPWYLQSKLVIDGMHASPAKLAQALKPYGPGTETKDR